MTRATIPQKPRGRHVTRPCAHCGHLVTRMPSLVNPRIRVFCSPECKKAAPSWWALQRALALVLLVACTMGFTRAERRAIRHCRRGCVQVVATPPTTTTTTLAPGTIVLTCAAGSDQFTVYYPLAPPPAEPIVTGTCTGSPDGAFVRITCPHCGRLAVPR